MSPPRARRLLADPGLPLFVTEGARKADAAVSRGLCCVGLLGVWNFRGTNGQGGKTVLADWEQVALNGREVYVAFDSDVMTKRGVWAALARLKELLERRGATVSMVYLLPGEGGAKVGLDDFLAAGNGVAELCALASRELRQPAGEETGEGAGVPFRAGPEGLVWLKQSGEGALPIRLTNFAAVISGDVVEDDGVELRRRFEIEATLHGRTARFGVAASQFAGMGWVSEQLGASAIVFPGFGRRDQARAAIQFLSGDVPERRLYTHLGWRELDGSWCYLHAGGATAATGTVTDVAVRPPGALIRFRLPDPPEGTDLREAIRASLRLSELAPDAVVIPIHAAATRAALGAADFSLHLAGPTGAGKTELAALAQQHFGPELDARHLPASWTSTANALEGLAFAAKDTLLVIDDFSPGGAHTDIQRAHQEADRVLRAQGNRSGRGRMSADSTLQPVKPPRGLVLSTGEDLPRGQSLRARLLTLELEPDALDWKALSGAQADAAGGLYAQAMAGFLRWLAPHYNETAVQLPGESARLRAAAQGGPHRRTPGIVADLAAAAGYFLAYALHAGAINQAQADERWQRTWQALGQAAAAQDRHQAAADPTRRFCELLAAALAAGRAHLTTADGRKPPNPAAWGWRQTTTSREEWQPQGDRVGWLTQEGIHLEPDAAHAAAQRLARDSGEAIPTGRQTLHKRLNEQRLLASTDQQNRGRLTVRRTFEGKRRAVLHLHPESLTAASQEQPGLPNHPPPPRPTTPANNTEKTDGTDGTAPDTDPSPEQEQSGASPTDNANSHQQDRQTHDGRTDPAGPPTQPTPA